ncbi:hypothetical protein YDYSG_59120 [Paenibacillus tyrfis]|uniref:glycosyltransferase n=1 Tax=Paenibacillus tyrfis TaxID=1501230 RepID=UPI00249303F7|nr:glycosyltransferase [Paenibacillus tyrfis]GLI09879.1 hypothetical protein YDYSG_59120 [Paenibacillus tyrfis]
MKKIPFDQYQRYRLTSDIINKVRGKDQRLTILEVGANEHKNLEFFLTDDKITYLDINVPDHLKEDKSYIQGDATEMPFSDGAYDFVVALDVFEHIPVQLRQKFLDELHRVGKYGFVLAAPFDTQGVRDAELRANSFFKTIYGMNYEWLEEHINNTLPQLENTLKYLRLKENTIYHFSHGSLAIWERMTKVHFFAAGKNVLYDYRFMLDDFYNDKLFQCDYGELCYRQFIVSLRESEAVGLIKYNYPNSNPFDEKDLMLFDQLEESFYRLASAELRSEVSTLYEQIRIKDSQLLSNFEHVQKISGILQTKLEQIAELNNSINNLKNQINEQSAVIESYKLLERDHQKTTSDLKDSQNKINHLLIDLHIKDEGQKLLEEKIKVMTIKEQEYQLLQNELDNKNQVILSKDEYISKLELMAQELRIKGRIKKVIKKIMPSFMWKKLKFGYRSIKLIRENPAYIKRGLSEISKQGVGGSLEKVKAKLSASEIQSSDYLSHLDEQLIKQEISKFNLQPLISIVMPVFNVDPRWLKLAIDSVQRQIYEKWELCIVDDCSTNPLTKEYLTNLNNTNIKIKFLNENQGISGASNEAVKLTDGQYIVLLDNDDEFMPDTLFEIVKAINHYDPDIIYSDEDKIDMSGNRRFPFFKPDWSPDLFRTQMYIGHIFCFKKSLFNEVGGFRKGLEGSQDYDLALRMTERTSNIHHIPKVLYSWRELETSTALNPHSKPYAHETGLRALNEHLERVYGKGKAWVNETEHFFVYDARYNLLNEKPKASIIIPTKDKVELLIPCINSIIEKTTYEQYEIIILNNNSELDETYSWFEEITTQHQFIKVVEASYEFNWSKLNNHGINEATGDVFIFLNNDTIIITPDWLERLSEKAVRGDVGTVGALLLYEDDTIQHAGVVIGMGGWADHVFKGMKPVHFGSPFVSPVLTRNVAASTGACLAISRKTIEKIGLFDENFIICGSDVEISLRAMKRGLFNIYDPNVRLYHLESKTRTSFVPECDFEQSAIHYSPYRENGDPYYNPNLSLQFPQPTVK